MVLMFQKELAMVLGTVVEMEPRSRRARLRMKKYMGCGGGGHRLQHL